MTSNNEIKRIVVVGAGGVGFWSSVILARESMGRVVQVWDDDTFEGGNGFQRLPRVSTPSQFKTSFLRGFVGMAMGDTPPEVVSRRFSPEEIRGLGGFSTTLIVDATDMPLEPRRLLWEAAQAAGAILVRGSYDGNGACIVAWGLPWASARALEGGYSQVPTLAQSFTIAGILVQAVHKFLRTGEQEQVVVRIEPGGSVNNVSS